MTSAELSRTEAPAAPGPHEYTADEMMTVAAARWLRDGERVFVGIGLPSTAANLARRSHAPNLVLVYESGTIGSKPEVLPLSIGDGELAVTADVVVSVPEIFNYWLQGGWIDVGFLGAAQLDRFGNLNTTVIGEYARPDVRLPGAGGAPAIATSAGEVVTVIPHSTRTLVAELDFVTTSGHLDGGDARRRRGLPGRGPTVVITDLGIMEPDLQSSELTLTKLHPGVEVDQVTQATGWPLRIADRLSRTDPPSRAELDLLRELKAAR